MKKYKLNYKKIKRNILIIMIILIFTLYIKTMSNYTSNNLKSCQEFSEYAQKYNIPLTQGNYINYINNK